MNSTVFALVRLLRYFLRKSEYTERYVDLSGEEGNNYVCSSIEKSINGDGLFIGKFGTIELKSVVGHLLECHPLSFEMIIESIRDYINLNANNRITSLCNNAGFFPNDISLEHRFVNIMLQSMTNLDILGSNVYEEKYINDRLKNIVRISLDSYLEPYKWEKPWTSTLQGKNVLVIHPFTESIIKQYEKRELLFTNKAVLPMFNNLYTIKAVQSIAGQKTQFANWFDALDSMKEQIDQIDFDIAIVGCGAYGFPLCSYIKNKRKIAIHMAGWTQFLFGIYGNRWIQEQPDKLKYINSNWIRPSENERPQNLMKVENGCYW